MAPQPRKAIDVFTPASCQAWAGAAGSQGHQRPEMADALGPEAEGIVLAALRACRDSNPKPSDLSTARARAARAWGLDVDQGIGQPEVDLSARILEFPRERTERTA